MSQYGIDWDGPISTDGDDTVVVPEFVEELLNPILVEMLHRQLQGVSEDKIIRFIVVRGIVRNLLEE